MNQMAAFDASQSLTSGGVALESGIDELGVLEDASAELGDTGALRARMARDGYLFLPGLLDRLQVLDARAEITCRLHAAGVLEAGTNPMEALTESSALSHSLDRNARTALTLHNAALSTLLYDGPMMAFFDRFLGESTRHYDYTWLRAVPPGLGTPCHADVVYMGRAERERLFTAWTPLGDIDLQQGGLMVLEQSCHSPELEKSYHALDVDAHCTNGPDQRDAWEKGSNGWLGTDPVTIRQRLGGRWLTTAFTAGDVLIFSIFTIHASLDNRSNRFRLSADSRYQPASKLADARWIGANPPGHGPNAKRGLIC